MSNINKDKENKLSWHRLVEILEYSPDTGIFINKIRGIGGRSGIGKEAGYITNKGYRSITIDKLVFSAHRLAWFYVYKEWPSSILDHIDGNKANNRLNNLRVATTSQNIHNTSLLSNNTSGYKGVTINKQYNKYIARIRVNKVEKYLGIYNTAVEASEAYKAAAKMYFGEFYNDGTNNS